MVKQAGIPERAKHAHTASVYSANKRKPEDHKPTKYDGIDICLNCPLEDCIGGKKCHYNLQKRKVKHEKREI